MHSTHPREVSSILIATSCPFFSLSLHSSLVFSFPLLWIPGAGRGGRRKEGESPIPLCLREGKGSQVEGRKRRELLSKHGRKRGREKEKGAQIRGAPSSSSSSSGVRPFSVLRRIRQATTDALEGPAKTERSSTTLDSPEEENILKL